MRLGGKEKGRKKTLCNLRANLMSLFRHSCALAQGHLIVVKKHRMKGK